MPPRPLAAPKPVPPSLADAALDTLASVVRGLGEFVLPNEEPDAATFRARAEAWANHVTIAAPPPDAGSEADRDMAVDIAAAGRRDWGGLRRFVRGYLQSSARQTETVVADLRQTVWLFIRNLHQAFAEGGEADAEIKRRLVHLEELAQAAKASDLKREVLATVSGLTEMLEARRHRQRAELHQLGERVRALGSELESARRDGETDPLTALINRKGFDEFLARTLEVCGAFGQEATLLLIDLDHFKTINDSHGHTTGDETLRRVSDAVVRVFLRKSDFCARYGGDELAVVLRETSAAQAVALAERVLRGVRALEIAGRDGAPLRPSVSIGIGAAAPGDDVKGWIDRADRGLYAAKQAGRDRAALGS
jgi:diguanylate cyclase (GGDEF)-like protein